MRDREDHFFKVVMETSVHHALHGFAQAAQKADGAVAGLAVSALPFLEDGDDYGLFPAGWKCPCVPGMIVNDQQFLFSQTSEVADHLTGNAILPWGFPVFLFFFVFCFSCLMAQFSSWMENSDVMLGVGDWVVRTISKIATTSLPITTANTTSVVITNITLITVIIINMAARALVLV